ncbi:hypothetical protein E2562_003274 [Oryza meyeriana var. granulata]|uniref:Uncharacterized protein n=1 Tax=Oryza meyeriana var. granulata TaxID=110450 RepID=A0A6G1EE54_9ORYZ|nr:hypothetical protein E2562_003274 [Oryza meyeriana var. granulata]
MPSDVAADATLCALPERPKPRRTNSKSANRRRRALPPTTLPPDCHAAAQGTRPSDVAASSPATSKSTAPVARRALVSLRPCLQTAAQAFGRPPTTARRLAADRLLVTREMLPTCLVPTAVYLLAE